jgi:hypothetical protein
MRTEYFNLIVLVNSANTGNVNHCHVHRHLNL